MSDIKELKDEDLEKVTGGDSYINIGDGFTIVNAWTGHYYGEWFAKVSEFDIAYNLSSPTPFGMSSFIANKYWHKDGEVWPCGTCSFGEKDSLYVIETPTIIHKDFTGTKPF